MMRTESPLVVKYAAMARIMIAVPHPAHATDAPPVEKADYTPAAKETTR